MIKTLTILGATGSIGLQSIDLVRENKSYILKAISCYSNVLVLKKILTEFKSIEYVSIFDSSNINDLKKEFPYITFFSGEYSLLNLIKSANSDVYLNGIAGFAGVIPSFSILNLNKILLLANKETLVVGGELINKLLDMNKGKLIPIDSEHVAISKCIYGKSISDILKITITASGGKFYNYKKEDLNKVSVAEATSHPNWSMGKQITVDSNTMINKTFELIEAFYLFRIPFDKIGAVVDRNSYVHGYVEFKDETRIQVSKPDMHEAIKFALQFGKPQNKTFKDVEINTLNKYNLLKLKEEQFPLLKYAKIVVTNGGDSGCCLNAINEVAVNSFINGQIKFIDIEKVIDYMMSHHQFTKIDDYHELIKIDQEIRLATEKYIGSLK